MRTSIGNELKQTPEGWWEIEIARAKVPADGWITIWAQHESFAGGQVNLTLGTDPNVGARIHLKAPESWIHGLVVDADGRPWQALECPACAERWTS